MDILDVYYRFLLKVNKNAINDNIAVDKGRFVILFNTSQNKYLDMIIRASSNGEVRNIQKFKVPNKELVKGSLHEDFRGFLLPEDYFRFVNVRAKGEQDGCEDFFDVMWEVKSENIHELYNDKFNEPSFDYRETFYTFGEDAIQIYRKGFDISNVFLTYYRFPTPVDIEGYIHFDGSHSTNVHPEFTDSDIENILDICVKDFNINSDYVERYQIDSNEINSIV